MCPPWSLMHAKFCSCSKHKIWKFCKKFGHLILRKIINFVATRSQILWLKCIKFNFDWGSAPDPTGGAYSAPPDPPAGFSTYRPITHIKALINVTVATLCKKTLVILVFADLTPDGFHFWMTLSPQTSEPVRHAPVPSPWSKILATPLFPISNHPMNYLKSHILSDSIT